MKCFARRWVMVAALVVPMTAGAMTVEDAYQAIPHRRTEFTTEEAKMPYPEILYLSEMFAWMDAAIVAKQEVFRNMDPKIAYRTVWLKEKHLEPPARLKPVQALISEAIKNQYAYLQEWYKMPTRSFNRGDARVVAASQRLQKAYGILMKFYPSETAHNANALFDYPCALDFL